MLKFQKRFIQNFLLVMIVLTITTGCNKSVEDSQVPLPEFDTEGHRGARGLMPENTIPAMLKAIDLGVSTLEMDVHVSADNEVILAHDHHINPAFTLYADGTDITKEEAENFAFYKMDYAAISTFDVGSKFYDKFPQQQKLKTQIPLLSKLIDSVQNYLSNNGKEQVFYNIETKAEHGGDNIFHPEPEIFVKLLMDVIEEKKIKPWVIVQSFDPRTLIAVHEKYPEVKTSFLVEDGTLENNLRKLGFLPSIYSPAARLVTEEMVQQCHKKGLKIIPWTVNTKEEMLSLRSWGVDGIISDYPDLFD